MKKLIVWLKNEEKAAATIIEYTIVLPVVLAIVFVLVFTGFIMHQKTILEAATARGAIYVSKTIADPSYLKITSTDPSKDSNELTAVLIEQGDIQNDPYRYLLRGGGSLPATEEDITQLIMKNQIFLDTAPTVIVIEKAGIFRKVVIEATQEYKIPTFLPGLELPPVITLTSESTVYVNQPSEFIRNADFTMSLLTKAVQPIAEELKSVMSKITFFKNKK